MKKDILIGIMIYIVALIFSGYSVFFELDGNGAVIPLFIFPVLVIAYYYYYKSTVLNKYIFYVLYWFSMILTLFSLLTVGIAIGDFGDFALVVAAIAIVAGFGLVMVLFVGYILVFVDSNNNGQDHLVLYIVLGVLTMGYILSTDIIVLPQVIIGIFIPLSLYTLYRLYIKGY